jgi:hypothetical protein
MSRAVDTILLGEAVARSTAEDMEYRWRPQDDSQMRRTDF